MKYVLVIIIFLIRQFDPMMHNACFEMDAPENCLPGQIGLVIKTGWAKNTTLLRYALV